MASKRTLGVIRGLTQQKMRSAVDKFIFVCEELSHQLTSRGHTISEAGLIEMTKCVYQTLLKEQELTLDEYLMHQARMDMRQRRPIEYEPPFGQLDRTPGKPCIKCGSPMLESRTTGLGYCRCWESVKPGKKAQKKGGNHGNG